MKSTSQRPNEVLRHQRLLRGWSQSKLAELVGTSFDQISRWEHGKTKPLPFFQEKFCAVFEMNAEQLGFLEPVALSYPDEESSPINEGEPWSDSLLPDREKESPPSAPKSIELSLPYASSQSGMLIPSFSGIQEEALSSLYEDMLIMGWDSFRRSKSPQVITKIDEHVNKLDALARSASIGEATHWQSLLCRFSQLATRIAQHRMSEPRALSMAKQAIMIAINLDDTELIASTFYGRGRVYMEYSNTTTDIRQKKRYFERAKADINAALGCVEHVRAPLAGNIYLLAAEIYALIAGNDMVLRMQCEKWQDKVALLVESDEIEDDGTFLKLNPTALHHERAKTLLRFGKIEEARSELELAWKTLQPNLFTWHMNMYLTQATLFLTEHDIEESAKSGLKAYTLAKTIHSYKGEIEVQRLLGHFQQLGQASSSVQALMMTMGGNA